MGAGPKTPRVGGHRKRRNFRTKLLYFALAFACTSATFFVIYLHENNGDDPELQNTERQHERRTLDDSQQDDQAFAISAAAQLFPEDVSALNTFCKAWRETQSNRVRDSFFWIRGLGVDEGLPPFSMAVPARTKGGAVGRALERQGTWAPEITDDMLDALHQAGEKSLMIDLGAGVGWFSLAAASANHPVISVEATPPRVAALRRSICANEHLQDRIALLSPPASTLITIAEMLLESAPKMVEVLKGQGLRVGAAVVHQGSLGSEAFEIMAASASILWPDITPLAVAMVLKSEGASDGGSSEATRQEKELEELASIVLHKVSKENKFLDFSI